MCLTFAAPGSCAFRAAIQAQSEDLPLTLQVRDIAVKRTCMLLCIYLQRTTFCSFFPIADYLKKHYTFELIQPTKNQAKLSNITLNNRGW